MCEKSRETTDHLLLHCEVVNELWDMISCLLRVQWIMLRWEVNLLPYWKRKFGRHHNANM